MHFILFFLILSSIFVRTASAELPGSIAKVMKRGGLFVTNSDGRPLLSHNPDTPFVPASTLKLATSLCALSIFRAEHRFETDFLGDAEDNLYVRASGDPSLISEELKLIAGALAGRVRSLNDIVIDTSLFDSNIAIDGSSATLQPYDAPAGAFIVNFGTIFVLRDRAGKLRTAELQTPLTPTALKAAGRLGKGEHRINLGKDLDTQLRHGGELLKAFLVAEGAIVRGTVHAGRVPSSATLVYRHQSTKQLQQLIKELLEYSTNFITNQLFLLMGQRAAGGVATIEKAVAALGMCLKEHGLKDFVVKDGAGLSRANRLTPRELVQLVAAFEPYRTLLPVKQGYLAKTGTLQGVSSLAGLLSTPSGSEYRFAVLLNDAVGPDYRFKVADAIRAYLTSAERRGPT